MGLLRRFLMSDRDPNRLDLSKYFTIEALEDELSVTISTEQTDSLYYCIDGDKDWKTLDNENPPTINTGQIISFKGEYTSGAIGRFSITKQCNLKGNIMSLLHGDYGGFNKTLHANCFQYLFQSCNVVNAHELKLPAATLANYCYEGMFLSCTNLLTTPELPATGLADYCYCSMFQNTAIKEAPLLPSRNLKYHCYEYMFAYCNNLTSIDCFPNDYLDFPNYASSIMKRMFISCKSLKQVRLFVGHDYSTRYNSNILGSEVFCEMFAECSSLEEVSLKNDNRVGFDHINSSAFKAMFSDCESLVSSFAISVSNCTIFSNAFSNMYYNCVSLTNCGISISHCDLYQDALGATFANCKSLTTAKSSIYVCPLLGSNALAYHYANCTGLKSVNLGQMTTGALKGGDFRYMFDGCSNLSDITIIMSDYNSSSFNQWVRGVSPTGVIKIQTDEDIALIPIGDNGIPSGWTCINLLAIKTVNSITSLTIESATNASWSDTTTRVKCRVNGSFVLENGYERTSVVFYTDSDPFEQNLTDTEVQRTISVTYQGLTATTTITQGAKTT